MNDLRGTNCRGPTTRSGTVASSGGPAIGKLAVAGGLYLALLSVNVQAAFEKFEDFDSLSPGELNDQNGWIDSAGSAEVVADPAGVDNQVMLVDVASGVLHRSLDMAQGTSRMVFLRLRFERHGAYSFGLTDVVDPDEYNDFGPELGMAASSNGDPRNELRVANGSTTGTYDEVTALLPDTWYNIWMMVDTASDTYQVWLNSTPNGDADSADQLANSSGETVFGFRTAREANIRNFFIKVGGGNSPIAGRFYLDDLFVENTDALNLDFPDDAPADSNGDGLSDSDAVALGLDPNDPDGDTDNDGLADLIEIGGDPGSPLDSDVDGIIDAIEPGIAAMDASIASGLSLPGAAALTISMPGGELLSDVGASSLDDVPASHDFPFGLIGFTVGTDLDASVTARLAFVDDLPSGLSLFNRNGVGELVPVDGDAWRVVDAKTVEVTLADGTATDTDATSDGFVQARLAPAVARPVSSSGGGSGCAVGTGSRSDLALPLLLLGTLGLHLRRRFRNALVRA